MGIRKLCLALFLSAFSMTSFASDQRTMNIIFDACEKAGGEYKKEHLSTNDKEICYKLKCAVSTSNASKKTVEEVKSRYPEASGAFAGAWVKACVPAPTNTELRRRVEGDGSGGNGSVTIDGNGDGSNNGNGKVTITGNGQDQRVNTGGNGNGRVVIRTDGGRGNGGGGSVVRGGGRVAFDVDGIQYHTLDHSFVNRCLKKTWFSFLRKNKYKLRKECRSEFGDYIISGSDIDTHIGRDIDGQGRGNGGGTVIIDGGGRGRGNGGGGRGTVVLDGGGRGRGSIDGGYYTVNLNGRTYRCAIGQSERECIGSDAYSNVYSRHSDPRLCIHCLQGRNRQQSTLNGIANIVGASGQILGPLFGYLGQRSWSKAYQRVGVANANAIASGYEQCQLMQTNYVQNTYSYIQNNELPDRTVTPPGCNGYNLGQFSGGLGYGGSFGGFGSPFGSAGYSTGFLGGMQGPYGQGYLPGMNVTGGFGNPQFGLQGGFGSPYGGFGNPGLNGGVNIGLGGGFGGGSPYGGFGTPGINGGISLGGGLGGSPYGGFNNPGFNGGINPGFNGGFNPGFNGGINAGFNGGINPGFNGGFNAGANGLAQWPNRNNGSYWSNTNPGFNGSWNGPYAQGQGSGYYNAQASHAQNYQARNIGHQYQGLALQNQYQRAGQNLSQHYQGNMYNGGGQYYGSAPYSPANMGLSLSGGFNFGI